MQLKGESKMIFPRLYVLSRADLGSKGYQAAQMGHVVAKFMNGAFDNTIPKRTWNYNDYIIYLSVEDEERLEYYAWKAEFKDMLISQWHEPDLEDSLTAIACEAINEKQAKLFQKLDIL